MTESESPGLRRLDADDVNRLASELDGQPYEPQHVDDDSQVGRVPDVAAGILTGGEESGSAFPPAPGENETAGGSPEDRAILREEETR